MEVVKKKSRTSQGRKKLEMVKIKKKSNLQVTFSKRRSGVFKKASELCTLCGVEIAMVVFSPANKPFSFGHPNLYSLAARFLAGKKLAEPQKSLHFSPTVDELNVKLHDLNGQLDGERKRAKSLDYDEMTKTSMWWESPVDELSLKELELFKASLEELNNFVVLLVANHSCNYNHVPFSHNNNPFPSDFPNLNYNFGFGNGIF